MSNSAPPTGSQAPPVKAPGLSDFASVTEDIVVDDVGVPEPVVPGAAPDIETSVLADAEVDVQEVIDELPDDDDEPITVDDVIQAFLIVHPTPTDEQVHTFATLIGMPYDEFEAYIFKMFGDIINDDENDDDLEELDEDDEIEEGDDEDGDGDGDDDSEPIDTLITSFFLWNAAPSDEQVHALANLAGVTPEALEERIYSLLGEIIADDDDEDEDEDDN